MTFHIDRPGIDRRADTQMQIAQIISYLEKLSNELNYHLNHLDQNNFPQVAAEEVANAAVLRAVNKELAEFEKRITAKLKGV